FAGNKAIPLFGPGGTEIDLHWAVKGAAPADILNRAETAQILDHEIPVVSAIDGLLLTARHAIRENLRIETICRDIVDIKLWCEHLVSRDLIVAAVREVGACGDLVPVLALTRIIESYAPASAASHVVRALESIGNPKENASSMQLVHLFDTQLREGSLGKD